MIKFKNKKVEYILIFFLILMENCFFLVDTKKINIPGEFAYSDIWLVLYILTFGLIAIKYCVKGKKEYGFSNYVLILCILVFISAFQQNTLTGQSMSLGIRPQRNYLIILLSYFPIKQLFIRKKIDIYSLMDFIYKIGLFSAVLFIMQKILINKVHFLYFLTRERNGSARFYIDSTLIQLSTIIAIYYFSTQKKNRYIVSISIFLVYQFWVTQGRLEIMSTIVVILTGIVFGQKLSFRKMIIFFISIVTIIYFFNTEYADNLIKAIQVSKTAKIEEGNTMAIRNKGRELYLQQLTVNLEVFLFGCGFPNTFYIPAVYKCGYFDHILLEDNGIYGFMYLYGLAGIATIFLLYIKMAKLSFKIKKETDNIIPLLYIILNICLCYNIIFWYWKDDGILLWVIMMCYIESLNSKIKDDKVKGIKKLNG